MKNLFLMVLVSVFGILMISGCAYGIRYDGPYEGRVIDADTGKPIGGAVVLGVWNREIITPGGATHNFYDAKETVTDNNGKFSIRGIGLEILSNVTPMDVLIFKVGYEHIGYGTWSSLKNDLILSKKIKWEGNKAIIPLKKLTMEERKKQGTPSFPSEAYVKGKMPLLIKEINKEEKAFGRPPYPEK